MTNSDRPTNKIQLDPSQQRITTGSLPSISDPQTDPNRIGDTLLGRAVDLVSTQLVNLRKLNEAARHLQDDAAQGRRGVMTARDEIEYRLRYLENGQLPPERLVERRVDLQGQLDTLTHRDGELAELQSDMEDCSRRLNLLVRQLEIAGSQLTRGVSDKLSESETPWELVLRAQLVEGQENERSRLAREIHDGPAQVLANAAMRLDYLSQFVRKDAPPLKDKMQAELDELTATMHESLLEMRRFMFNLKPSTIERLGLTATLLEYCADFGNQYDLEIEVDLPPLKGLLTPDQELAVFRIAQESLQNIRKHAEARRVKIFGSRDADGWLTIIVRDDGKGFTVQHTADVGFTHGAGIMGMRERAELANSKLRVKSVLGQGTEVIVRIKPGNVNI